MSMTPGNVEHFLAKPYTSGFLTLSLDHFTWTYLWKFPRQGRGHSHRTVGTGANPSHRWRQSEAGSKLSWRTTKRRLGCRGRPASSSSRQISWRSARDLFHSPHFQRGRHGSLCGVGAFASPEQKTQNVVLLMKLINRYYLFTWQDYLTRKSSNVHVYSLIILRPSFSKILYLDLWTLFFIKYLHYLLSRIIVNTIIVSLIIVSPKRCSWRQNKIKIYISSGHKDCENKDR